MSRTITFSKALNEALHQEMERDEKVFVIGEDVAKMGGDFGITSGIWVKWPDRAFDTALSEAAIVGLSCGAAVCGLRPVDVILGPQDLNGLAHRGPADPQAFGDLDDGVGLIALQVAVPDHFFQDLVDVLPLAQEGPPGSRTLQGIWQGQSCIHKIAFRASPYS